jgi:hypothetical protein
LATLTPLNYSITEEGNDYNGSRIQEWKNLHQPKDGEELTKDQRTDNARVKQRLLSLGVPEDVMNQSDTSWIDNLKGIEVYVTVFERPSSDGTRKFTNVGQVKLLNE